MRDTIPEVSPNVLDRVLRAWAGSKAARALPWTPDGIKSKAQAETELLESFDYIPRDVVVLVDETTALIRGPGLTGGPVSFRIARVPPRI